MNLSDINRVMIPRKWRTRVGRGIGSGLGKTAGRGFKGQTSRAGWRMQAGFAGGQMPLFRRLPKRGFTNATFKVVYDVVNVGDLNGHFAAGATVDVAAMASKGLVRANAKAVKVLGHGTLDKALTIHGHAFSKSARAAIEKVGGKAEGIA